MKAEELKQRWRQYTAAETDEISRGLQEEIHRSGRKIIVLDDDPTGTQTVHGISVYAGWDRESIESGFEEKNNLFYILTDSRAMPAGETEAVHRDIAEKICAAAKNCGRDFIIISRSDSTLRGHYPLETETLRDVLERERGPVNGEVLCPCFPEGGRLTAGNIHYVIEGGEAVPAADTEFAKDRTFGYRHSDLCLYVEEKSGGRCPASSVMSIPLDMLRALDIDAVADMLLSAEGFRRIVVNALEYSDLKVFCIALYRALRRGGSFLFRSAASLVKTMAGISDMPLLAGSDLKRPGSGGLVIAGSYTKRTTAQLREAEKLDEVIPVAFNSDLVTDPELFKLETERAAERAAAVLAEGRTALLYTRREPLRFKGDSGEDLLAGSVAISGGLRRTVKALISVHGIRPRFILTKGGITSSDIAVKALGIKRADVLGQIKPGVPVWRCGPESICPDTPLIIFPGNVGDDGTLKEIIAMMSGGI